MGGKFTFTFESREQVNEMFSLKVYFINSNLSNNFFIHPKTLRNDPFTINLHHFVDDSTDA